MLIIQIACKENHMKYTTFFINICNPLPNHLSTAQSKMHAHGKHFFLIFSLVIDPQIPTL